MANIAIERSFRTVTWPRFRIPKRWRVFLRLVRREQLRRRALDQLLAETRDPRILADIGFALPRRTIIERWAATMLHHRR